jgi:hypothetical protein
MRATFYCGWVISFLGVLCLAKVGILWPFFTILVGMAIMTYALHKGRAL